MAKVSRDMLKSLVKECLFEILLESTGDNSSPLMERRQRTAKAKPKRQTSRGTSRPALDTISFNDSVPKPQPRSFDASGITSDPVMASIFEDTAKTTLVEQAAAERGRPGQVTGPGIAIDAPADNNPFGAASKNWAHLAFADKSE